MTKPYGWFTYRGLLVEFAAPTVVNVFTTDDDRGDRLGGAIPGDVPIDSWSQYVSGGPATAIRTEDTPVIDPVTGLLTGLTVVLANDGPTDGVIVKLFVRVGMVPNLAH